jgi:uncharacterized protein YndB with AHSA1/START domain
MTTELSRVERKILVRAPRERVWKVLTTVDDFSKWFEVETSGTFVPGARLHVTSTNAACKGLEFEMVVDRMEPPRMFSWRWHPGMPDLAVDYSKEPMTLVVFELTEIAGGTEVMVTETGFDRISLARRARVLADNDKGWEIMLVALEKYVDAAAER